MSETVDEAGVRTKRRAAVEQRKGMSEQGHVNHGLALDEGGGPDSHISGAKVLGQPSPVGEVQEDAYPKRAQWTNQREFLLSCIAMSVGVGNIWRFPFIAYDNGGGAFLIPYILVLMFIGKPLYYMEFVLGQFASCGPVKIWEICPAFRGVGYGQAIAAWTVLTFYVSLMGLCAYYFFASFSSVLPWATCGPWASAGCFDTNMTGNLTSNSSTRVSAAEEYFKKVVLKVDPQGFDNGLGSPDMHLALCLLLSWIFVFLSQVKGVKSTGKAAYFTAIFPYVVLLIMLIRGLTLPGAFKGVLYFITPRWKKLLDPGVWYAAVDQCFFSLSVGFGMVTIFSSYNPFRQNVYRDAAIISFMDTFTCIFGGVTIFSILGHLAELLGVEIDEVVRGGGTPLAFVSYPDALARFEYVPQLFSALFFFMLFTLGVGSAIGYNQVAITIICDEFPNATQWKVALVASLAGLSTGIIYTIPQGQHILTIVNYYGGGMPVIFLMICELIAIMWIYGIKNFLRDIEFMLNRKMSIYWKACWVFFIPLFLILVFIYGQITSERLNYGDYVFGDAPTYFGMAIAIIACLMLPLNFFILLIKRWDKDCSVWQNIAHLFKPTSNWCPKDPKLRQEYLQFKQNHEQSVSM
ncbi:sodium-dependent nutrient amino acid transporter 1-like isoform X1 [Macrobrachium nipponense]|uniref:sodium-dependent nutrient amino acid transporter 1-like isoform X1 n=1 Tax=Macrobrachium nipponense TaxID=159736 RepID=UPI0030C838A2